MQYLKPFFAETLDYFIAPILHHHHHHHQQQQQQQRQKSAILGTSYTLRKVQNVQEVTSEIQEVYVLKH
jgi:hypothetical protein